MYDLLDLIKLLTTLVMLCWFLSAARKWNKKKHSLHSSHLISSLTVQIADSQWKTIIPFNMALWIQYKSRIDVCILMKLEVCRAHAQDYLQNSASVWPESRGLDMHRCALGGRN